MSHTSCITSLLAAAVVGLGSMPAAEHASSESVLPLIQRVEKLIPRFQQVDERMFRGGQPDRAGFDALRGLGVRTVINLRGEHDERELVEKLGMKYVYVPVELSLFGSGSRMPESAVRKFFEVVDDVEAGPIFVHCRRGADRTGAIVGFYRIARQGWDANRAYREARQIGMQWWFRGLKDQLNDFAKAVRQASEGVVSDPSVPVKLSLTPGLPH
jgi:protein tyrosine phosphatase (PTP) superfamily phosphohydrolase (DUF442 family)